MGRIRGRGGVRQGEVRVTRANQERRPGSDTEIPARKFNKGFGCVVLGSWLSRERQGGKRGVKEG